MDFTASSQRTGQPVTFTTSLLKTPPVSEREARRIQEMVYNWDRLHSIYIMAIHLIAGGSALMRRNIVLALTALLIIGGVIIASSRIPPSAAVALSLIGGLATVLIIVLAFIWPRKPKE